MKKLLWSIAKLNTIALAVFIGLISLIGQPSAAIAFFMAAYVIYIIYLNVQIIYKSRQDISRSLRDGAINAAASAIEFRDAARARVNERIEERKRNSDGKNDNINPEIEDQFSEAIRQEDLATVERLLFDNLISAHGCNRNGRGWLQYATITGSVKAAEAIIQAGASPQEKDVIGRSAIEEAEIRENFTLIALFKKQFK